MSATRESVVADLERGGNRTAMRDHRRTLAAGDETEIAAAGDFVFVQSATADFDLILAGQTVGLKDGDRIGFRVAFNGFRIHNTSAGALAVVLLVGFGEFERAAVVGTITNSKASVFNTASDEIMTALEVKEVLPANLARRVALIGATASNANPMRVGDSNVGIVRGTHVPGGEVLAVETTEAIWVFMGVGGGSLTLSWTED